MATSEAGTLALAFVAGAALGALFFGGLWWTVQRGVASATPARLFLGSAVLRMGLTLAGFYFAAGGQMDRLLLCTLGFLIARALVTRLTKPSALCQSRPTRTAQESRHAP